MSRLVRRSRYPDSRRRRFCCASAPCMQPHASKQVWGLERQAGDAVSLKWTPAGQG
jgi:hypothetical protein